MRKWITFWLAALASFPALAAPGTGLREVPRLPERLSSRRRANDSSVTAGQTYTYSVQALDPSGNVSGSSNLVSITP